MSLAIQTMARIVGAQASGEEEIRVISPPGPERGVLLSELIQRARKVFTDPLDIEILGRVEGKPGARLRIGKTTVVFLTPEEERTVDLGDVERPRTLPKVDQSAARKRPTVLR